MSLSAEQRTDLFFGHCLLAIAINFVLNGLIGWAVFHEIDPVPTWAVQSAAGPDLIGTCFFLPAITCLIVTPLVRRHVRSGSVAPLPDRALLPAPLRALPAGLPARAGAFGAAGLALAGGGMAVLLLGIGPESFPLVSFLWVKALFSAGLGGVVQPLIGVTALADPLPEGA